MLQAGGEKQIFFPDISRNAIIVFSPKYKVQVCIEVGGEERSFLRISPEMQSFFLQKKQVAAGARLCGYSRGPGLRNFSGAFFSNRDEKFL